MTGWSWAVFMDFVNLNLRCPSEVEIIGLDPRR
jgi:hypothetical protein